MSQKTYTAEDAQITIGSKKSAPDHPVRFSFLTVDKPRLPRDPKPGDKAKYSVMAIVKKDSPDVARINEAMRAAAALGKDTRAVDFDTLDLILRDGDDPKQNKKKHEYLKGHYFFNATANPDYPPDVVGRFKDPETGKLERLVKRATDKDGNLVGQIKRDENGQPAIKSGDYGAVTINFYGYSTKGNIGVAAGLRNVQKLATGSSLASGSNADDEFEADEEDDEFMK